MLSPRRVLLCALATGLVALCGALVPAQEFRGSVTGRVTEASGAAVAGAQVTITNVATNAATTTLTNEAGSYTILYLNPGSYALAVEAQGFKRAVRQGIEVRVGDRLEFDLALEVGAVAETVNVTADASLLETSTASAGQVIDRRRISELPLSDGNPFVLTRLAPGIAYTGDLLFSRPFDNGGTSSIVADGASGGNEFTLDGSPNQASGRRVAFVPPADAVQEFKVETASFDGQQAHTAGATVNVTLRSGTNDLHGTLYEFVRNDILSANDFFLNRTGRERTALRYNRYGGTVGGPILLPKKVFGPLGYDGRDRTFFFFSYEGLKDVFPEPDFRTVPTLAERNGDFSALLPNIIIYDPLTARAEGSRVRRDPIQCQGRMNVICPERISQIARNYLQYYPLPNLPGDSQGRNNFISGNPRSDTFHSESVRVDQTLTEKQKFFVRVAHNFRRESRGAWAGEVNGIVPIGNFLFRINNSVTYDHVYTMSPTTILNFRVGYSRFLEKSTRQHEGAIDPASLGFSPQTAAAFGDVSYLPRFDIAGFSLIGENLASTVAFNIYSFQPTLTKIVGNHSFRVGYDLRSYRENSINPGRAAGQYDFRTNYTRGPLDNAAGAPIGQDLASFMLGLPTGGSIERNAGRSNQTLYHGIFVHDDWKVNRKLTLNLGLRYELEGATTERYNRNIRGFDATVSSPIEAAAKAAYAASPIPEVSPSNFNVRGGLLFADEEHRGFYDADTNNLQPRVGFAYQLNEKTVLRGGFGVYTIPAIIAGVQQPGFSQATNIVPTLDNGLTFRAGLFNPFPDGVAEPPGSSLGIATFLGRNLIEGNNDPFLPLEVANGQTQRWEFGLQRELPGNWLIEAAYVGNRGSHLTVVTDLLNAVPLQYLSTSPVRDTATINFLTAQVANPFRNLLPGTGFNGATIARQQLLRPFPEFDRIRTIDSEGSSIYHSGQLRAEKRFTKGYTLLMSYTWSKYLEEVSYLNASDTELERRISRDDVPHRVVLSGIWELPFGRGRKWGSDWRGPVEAILGGWQAQAIFQWQSGRPLDLVDRNVVYFGDPSRLRAEINSQNADPALTVFETSGFYFTDAPVQTNGVPDPVKQRADSRISLANNLRYFPTRLPGLRGQPLNLWDISVIKNIAITERVKFQLRGEFLNAFNHAQFSDPETNPTSSNFGKVTSQANLPRNVQIGLKLIF